MKKNTALSVHLLKKSVVALLWFAVWMLLFYLLRRPIILESPAQTIATLFHLLLQGSFWVVVLNSFLQILLTSLLSSILGMLLSVLHEHSKTAKLILSPFLRSDSIVTVASYSACLWLLFCGFKETSILIAILISIPMMHAILSDARNAFDRKLFEMANCFADFKSALWYVGIPHAIPYFFSGISRALNISWKITLVIETVNSSAEQNPFVQDFDELFSWVAVVIVVCAPVESLLNFLAEHVKMRPEIRKQETPVNNGQSFSLLVENISKHYGDTKVFEKLSYIFPKGKTVAVLGLKGCGKTTLLSILSSLEQDDECRYKLPPTAPGIIFQENRLIPYLSVAENIRLANRGVNEKKILTSLALTAIAEKFPYELDQGTQRIVAIGRAIAFQGGIGIFDEPFIGLDEDTKALCAHALFSAYKGKTVIFSTTDPEEARRYADEILEIK